MGLEHCFSSVQLVALRVAELTAGGSPNNAGNGYVSDAPIKVDIGLEIETGDEFTQKNGAGILCAQFKDCDRIKRATLAMDLCQLDAELISLLTGSDTFESGGNTIGLQLPSVSADCPAGTCVELWTKAWDGAAQAVPTFTDPNPAYFHWVFPRVVWTLGNITLENGIATIPVSGLGTENAQITANGPFDDWPTEVSSAGGVTRVGGFFLDDAVPTAECGFITVTSAGS